MPPPPPIRDGGGDGRKGGNSAPNTPLIHTCRQTYGSNHSYLGNWITFSRGIASP